MFRLNIGVWCSAAGGSGFRLNGRESEKASA
jgi:hypothetical protein